MGHFFLCNKNTCRRSGQLSHEDYLQKWTPQSPCNLHHGHNQIKTIFIMGVRGSRKGYSNPKRISFLSVFSFPLRLEPCVPWQLNVMAICSGVRRKFSWGCFIQWHMVVIFIWCALFVTSQFDVILMFPNQRFGEVCWHNMHIFLHPLILCVTALNINCQQSKLGYRRKINPTTQQFITAKITGCALKQGSKTHSSTRENNSKLQNEAR